VGGVRFEGLAQGDDDVVDDAGVRMLGQLPDFGEELAAGDDLVGTAEEDAHDGELFVGELDDAAAGVGLVGLEVHPVLAEGLARCCHG
jgi:hypothetical protein